LALVAVDAVGLLPMDGVRQAGMALSGDRKGMGVALGSKREAEMKRVKLWIKDRQGVTTNVEWVHQDGRVLGVAIWDDVQQRVVMQVLGQMEVIYA
jgi:hypothetical protein